MFGTRFELDEEKIEREGIYDLQDIRDTIDRMAQKENLIKISEGYYVAREGKNSLAEIGAFTNFRLINSKWFTTNIKFWEFITDNNTIDLISRNKKEGYGAWA